MPYVMHPATETAYQVVHQQFDNDKDWQQYRFWNQSQSQEALQRKTPVAAAFNFHYYFPTHYFKARHALESERIIGQDKLVSWLRYNPYLTIVDIGCGDGAGSIAAIESVIRLREKKLIDHRTIQLHCIGIDPNPHGLAIYEAMVEETQKYGQSVNVSITYEVCPHTMNEAIGSVESALRAIRLRWQQPSLSHTIVVAANVNDLLNASEEEVNRTIRLAKPLKSHSTEPFGQQLSAFHYHLFELVPIDHLHIITIDTEPQKIKAVVEEMRLQVMKRFSQQKHGIEDADLSLDPITFENPNGSFWRKYRKQRSINPYITSTIHIHNRQLEHDGRWQQIKSRENLELAWARARREMLREAFVDETEIRLFEYELESNLERLHHELDAYAIRAGYFRQSFSYNTPKNPENVRPRGLTWLEEEILIIAIIQVLGTRWLQQPRSYAYRLAPDNSPERGSTEYLYELWSKAWKDYRNEISAYAREHLDGVVITTDIKSYFTRILQDRLKEIIKDELDISTRIEWLVELLVSKELVGHDVGRGLVQGSTGSGFMANLYLSSIDYLFPPNDAKGRRLFRYVDDIVVVVPNTDDRDTTKEVLYKTIRDDLNLEINVEKSDCIPTRQYLPQIDPDEVLDTSHKTYEALLTPLWRMDAGARRRFNNASTNEKIWWTHIANYRLCLIELGIFVPQTWLSRKLMPEISNEDDRSDVIDFPAIPSSISVTVARQWAEKFRAMNPKWLQELVQHKNALIQMFLDNLTIIDAAGEDTDDPEVAAAGRRIRFAANRLGILGFDGIHRKLTESLCNRPWLIRYQQLLLGYLAVQGYSEEVWRVIDFYDRESKPMSNYMCAIAIRALRFLPRLTPAEWQRLTEFMTSDDDLVRLMATETWLAASSQLPTAPLRDTVKRLTNSVLAHGGLSSQRLLKNYLLILGRIEPADVTGLELNCDDDPLLATAYAIACSGSTAKLFLKDEPDKLRMHYYSSKFEPFEDDYQ